MRYKVSRQREFSPEEFIYKCEELSEAKKFVEKEKDKDRKENQVNTLYRIYDDHRPISQTEWQHQDSAPEKSSSHRSGPTPCPTTLKLRPGGTLHYDEREDDEDNGNNEKA